MAIWDDPGPVWTDKDHGYDLWGNKQPPNTHRDPSKQPPYQANGQWVWSPARGSWEFKPYDMGHKPRDSAGANSQWEWDQSVGQWVSRAKPAASPEMQQNPFGNEMMGYQQQYTPFGLQQSSAFGAFGGGGRTPYSYLSDQLVPSLESRRMGMISQMFNGGK